VKYNIKMVEASEDLGIKEDITCLVCGKLKKEVYECMSCHKFYCKDCSNSIKMNNQNCINCDSTLKTTINIGFERLIELNAIKPICQNCKRKFDKPEEYNIHIEKCIHQYYECKICDNSFLTKDLFIKHIQDNHKDIILKEYGKEIKNEKNI
jgi:hypothetical protein